MSATFRPLARLFPARTRPPDGEAIRRIVLILPCCIGDVVLGTATLRAVRRAYPDAHITWAVGRWSRAAVENHDALDALLDTGARALPVYRPRDFWGFVRDLRRGRYDLAVSLVRSPLMSLAVWCSGIRWRAGLDSAGRGFGYNIRAPLDPDAVAHEAEIYLSVARALGLSTADCYANAPVSEAARASLAEKLRAVGVGESYVVVNPAGGRNPGMVMDAKRWPPELFAALIERLRAEYGVKPVLLAGPGDDALVGAIQAHLSAPAPALVGALSFPEIAALAAGARLYVGNDTGLTHYAAAAGAPTLMIFGPSDPARYAPFTSQGRAVWKPTALAARGVTDGPPPDWDWARDGVDLETVFAAAGALIR